MNRWVKALLLLAFLGSLSACEEKSAEEDDGYIPQGAGYWVSYEARAMGCETDRHTFEAATNDQLLNDVCNTLANNSVNKNCAAFQRKVIFEKLKCGKWPHAISDGLQGDKYEEYSFRNDTCGTGRHMFAANADNELKELFCEAIADEKLNLNCARAKREKVYFEKNCDKL